MDKDNEDDLKNEDNLKNKDNIKIRTNIKIEEHVTIIKMSYLQTVPSLSWYDAIRPCFHWTPYLLCTKIKTARGKSSLSYL